MDEASLRKLWAASLPEGADWGTLSPGATYRPARQMEAGGERALADGHASVEVLDDSVGVSVGVRVVVPDDPSERPTVTSEEGASHVGANVSPGPRPCELPTIDLALVTPAPQGARVVSGPRAGSAASTSAIPVSAASTGDLTSTDSRLAPTAGFELLEEIGRGGMGVVYRARQRSLDREVAVKRIRPALRDASIRERFLDEARVTGVLDHPNVVPVHELGHGPDGEVYLAMKLVGGTSWKDILHPRTDAHRELATNHDATSHVRILLSVMNAVAYAHSRGIAHRDLKPENVMVGEFGEVLVMDWGIACDFRDGERRDPKLPHKTSWKGPAGTPSYMSPELAEGRSNDVGPWTDVYLLGAILFEIVTGTPPHGGTELFQVLLRAAESRPPVFGADVPEALAAICRRALARDPAKRFATVTAMQEEVRAFLAHKESAKVAQAAQRGLDRCEDAIRQSGARRAGGGAPSSTPERNRLYLELAEAVAGFRQALVLWEGNEVARRGERHARLSFARAALEAGDLGLAEAQAAGLAAEDGEACALRKGVAESYAERNRAERRVKATRRTLATAAIVMIVVLSAAIFIVQRAARRTARERDRAQVAERAADASRQSAEAERARAVHAAWQARIEAAQGLYDRSFRYTDEGRPDLAMACLLRSIELAWPGGAPEGFETGWGAPGWAEASWLRYRYLDLLRGRPLFTLLGPKDHARAVWVLPFGTKALSASDDGAVRLWDLVWQVEAARFPSHEGFVYAVVASSDGELAASAGQDGFVRIFELPGGAERARVKAHASAARALAISQSGRRLVSGGDDGVAHVLEMPSGRSIARFDGHRQPVLAVALSDDGKVAATGGADGLVRLWDTDRAGEITRLRGHTGWVSAVALSDETGIVVSGSYDRSVRVWDALDGQELRRLDGHAASVLAVRLSQDGRLLLSGAADGQLHIWDTYTGRLLQRIDTGAPDVLSIALSPDELVALTASSDGAIRGWDLQAVRERHRLEGHGIAVGAVAADRGGRTYSGGADGKVLVWDPASEQVTWFFVPGAVTHLFAHPEERRVLIASHDAARGVGQMAVYDTVTGEVMRPLWQGPKRIVDVAIAPRVRRALVAWDDQSVAVVSMDDGAEIARIALREAWSVSMDEQGKLGLFGLADGTARLWDLADADPRELLVLTGHTEEVSAVALSRDGTIALTGSSDRTARVWEVATGRELRRLEGHERGVSSVVLSRDGRVALSGSADRTARVWDVATGHELRRLEGHLAGVDAVSLSPDGNRALTGSTDTTVRVWQLLDPDGLSEPPTLAADNGDPLRSFAPFYAAIGYRVVEEGPRQGAIVPVDRSAERSAPR